MKIEDMPKDFTGNCWLHAADGTVLMSYTNLDRDTGRRRFYSFTTIESPMSNHSLEPFKEYSKFEFPTQKSKSITKTIQRLHGQIEDNRKDLLAKDDELVSVKIDRAELQKAKDNLFKEIHRHCEIKDQMEEDLALLKDILKVFVKERNSRE